MKHVLTALCLAATALLLISCGGEKTESTGSHAEHAAPAGHAEHADHPEATADVGLVLNDGQKWQMDDHTRASFATMAASFVAVDAAALGTDDLKKAGTGLKADLDGLIKGCTMTGPDHDQLHVYLSGFIPAVTALQESGQLEDARQVQHYLRIYGDYFE